MSDVAIKVEGLGKEYIIGHQKQGDLMNSFNNTVKKFFQKKDKESFWALKDVSFEIKMGEAVGIIGRNGAGKSTLLKILSRITDPTKGRFEINGRVSSLLEVGTGFHPELSGRENIYLNGTILGMKRREIKAKFDEIIAFSGVEKFLDTPVKHYSSGMKVRLAFSVAAHLEPEILIIDEVLAVGDSIFQAKCIDKMTEVAESGKTILFVSHNMQAVKNLCNQALLIDDGKIKVKGKVSDIILEYTEKSTTLQNNTKNLDLTQFKRSGRYKEGLTFKKICFNKATYKCGDSFTISIELKSDRESYSDLLFGININDTIGNNILHLSNIFINSIDVTHSEGQKYLFEIPQFNLKPGYYSVNLFLKANEEIQDWLHNVAQIIIEESNMYDFSNSKMITGIIQPQFSFSY